MRSSHVCRGLTAALLLMSTLPGAAGGRASAAAADQEAAVTGGRKQQPRGYEQFQVAAGNTLQIELRTPLSSDASARAAQVEGRLLRAIEADGVELVPAGAAVMGTVTDVEPAGPKKPGRLAFTFHVIEHPQTGSRATIRASVRSFESVRPPKGKVFPDVRLDRGLDASVLLLAPLVVRLPVGSR